MVRSLGEAGPNPVRMMARPLVDGPWVDRTKEPTSVDSERIYLELFRDDDRAFWLDSRRTDEGIARFSFMGSPHRTASYAARERVVTVREGDAIERVEEDIFAFLRRELIGRRVALAEGCEQVPPFGFMGGFVGYLGYEVRVDTGGGAPSSVSSLPDAFFGWVDRFVAVDHLLGHVWLVALREDGAEAIDAIEGWFAETEARLRRAPALAAVLPTASDPSRLRRRDARDKAAYLSDIATCLAHIAAGDAYELCLTNEITVDHEVDPVALHGVLRRINPAPLAALLRAPGFAIVSSSPELFLSIRATGEVVTKPIKGTAPRGATPDADEQLRTGLASSEKARSENVMIVDLLRNDLGVVCRLGSVRVPDLMVVETHPTVHQLVSRIVGHLRPDAHATDCVRAAFPGGSMTGAPKRKAMEILDRLEGRARGVYAGALGYFSIDGSAELSIVIRTAIVTKSQVTIGVGGAILALSDPEAEYAEMQLKAEPLLRAITDVVERAPRYPT